MASNADSTNFDIKDIEGLNGSQSILLQNENGPCALIAIVNILVLRDSPMAACVHSHHEAGSIDESTVLAKLGETTSASETGALQMSALFEFLPKLSMGLDVNPRFDGTFAHSPELDVFESFGIKLVHSWVLGELEANELGLSEEEAASLSKLSYEQLCAVQFSDSPNEKFTDFLERYPTQMTTSGYIKLSEQVQPGQFAVLFWNNHFSTLVNHDHKLYTLVTDLGFQRKSQIVWEEVNEKGAGAFVNGAFRPADDQERNDELLARQLASEEPSAQRTLQSSQETNHHRPKGVSDQKSSESDPKTNQKPKSKKKKECIIA